jgi:hypothetical protein
VHIRHAGFYWINSAFIAWIFLVRRTGFYWINSAFIAWIFLVRRTGFYWINSAFIAWIFHVKHAGFYWINSPVRLRGVAVSASRCRVGKACLWLPLGKHTGGGLARSAVAQVTNHLVHIIFSDTLLQ